jgi:hypothetical protein
VPMANPLPRSPTTCLLSTGRAFDPLPAGISCSAHASGFRR